MLFMEQNNIPAVRGKVTNPDNFTVRVQDGGLHSMTMSGYKCISWVKKSHDELLLINLLIL